MFSNKSSDKKYFAKHSFSPSDPKNFQFYQNNYKGFFGKGGGWLFMSVSKFIHYIYL